MNKLFFGDCYDVLRNKEEIPEESVDLVYIDPPFNSKRNYSIFFDDNEIQTQHVAFQDTWSYKNIQDSLVALQSLETEGVRKLLEAYRSAAPHAFPYLVMMALRILELHKVLKKTGSFYLHCDPTMSHYLKTLCDLIFGAENFRNEVIWDYTFRLMDLPRFYNRKHDVILFYAKSKYAYFRMPKTEWTREEVIRNRKQEVHIDEDGDEWIWMPGGKGHSKNKPKKIKDIIAEGKAISDVWQIPIISSSSKERLGYPTQKPLSLLKRIIEASSKPNDVVLDAFCGCGTTVDAAESLHRQWIGIDISPTAVNLIKNRLKDTYKKALSSFTIRGTPTDYQTAVALWKENPNAFQDWWVMEFDALSPTFGTSGSDKGIDGIALYQIDLRGGTMKVAFQVKGGGVGSKDMDALLGAMEKHKCEGGVFLTIEPPTKPMQITVAGLKQIDIPSFKSPKVQILTLKEFFSGERPKLPLENITFAKARFKSKQRDRQNTLDL